MTRRLLAVLLLAPLALVGCQDEATTPTGPDATPSAAEVQASQSSAGGVDVVVQLDREFAPGAHAPNKARAAEIAGELGIEARYTYGTALFGFAGAVPEGRLEALERDPRVVLVERDFPVHAIAQTLPAGIDRIEADQNGTAAIDGSPTGVDVDIGIIDTGIDLDHPDLNPVDGINCIDSGATADDDHGHGTHVAGTSAAIDDDSHVVGAAPGARVHAVKVLDSGGSGSISSVVCGIDYVTNNASTFEVANMSLGAQGTSSTMRTAIQNSVDAGVFYAVAAGNDGADVYGSDGTFGTSDDFIPAAYPEVAAVSAMADFDGSAGGNGGSPLFIGCGRIDDDTFAQCFSNFSQSVVSGNPVTSPGAAIDLAAPGVSVLSTTNDGSTGNKTGTSMSSPHVAGVAALYIVQNGLSPSSASDVYSVRQALIDAGQPQSDWQNGDTNDPDSNPERLVWAVFDGSSGGGGDTNSAPTASFTYDCTDLACDFDGSGSSDSDGSISSYDWDFGDGNTGTGVTVSHTYASEGTYTVTLTVTDDDGATDSSSQDVSVTEATSGDFSLSATGYKVRGRHHADLEWSGATSTNVDIYRDGSVIATTENDGFYTDSTNNVGGASYTYQVCEAGTTTCSNEAMVTF